ncbi:MAG: hypothetical protein HGA30_07140 [Anaerolineales bacterium]|nr:hypothetical protein [Anaerolineales bacterium]
MAKQEKVVVKGKVQKDNANRKKFRINKDKDFELDIEIEIEEDGEYETEKLSTDKLPTQMNDGTSIKWFNNFAVKKNGVYINQRYRVTIPGLAKLLEKSRLVIFNGNGDPYYYKDPIANDTFILTNGDSAVGKGP